MHLLRLGLGVLAATMAFCTFGCSASGPKFERLAVPPGQAIVYVYRSGSMLGAAVEYNVLANDHYVANITNGGYYPYVASPGMVKFGYVSGMNPVLIGYHILAKLIKDQHPCGELEVEAGHEYFMHVAMNMFGMDLEEVEADKALAELSELRRFSDPAPGEDPR